MEFEETTTDILPETDPILLPETDILPETCTTRIQEPIYNISHTIRDTKAWVNLYNLKYLIIHYKNPYLYIAVNVSNDNTDALYKPDQSKIQATIDYLGEFYNQNEDLMFGSIYNLSNLGSIEIKHMHMFATFMKSIAAKTDRQVYAISIIIKSSIVISLLNTFLVLYNNSRPIKIVNNIKDAKLFIKKEMIYYNTNGKLNSI